MRFTYQELTDLRAILKNEIKRWIDEMQELEKKHPGTRQAWHDALEVDGNMPTPEAELYDHLYDQRFKAEGLLEKIDREEF